MLPLCASPVASTLHAAAAVSVCESRLVRQPRVLYRRKPRLSDTHIRYNYVAVAKTTPSPLPCSPRFIAPFTLMGTSLCCGHSDAHPAQCNVVTFIFV